MENTLKRNTPYKAELDFIENVRSMLPKVGPYTLARRISAGEFDSLGSSLVSEYRTYYSILSVIRRYDARQNA